MHQIIKEVTVKENSAWEQWLNTGRDPKEFEDEICTPATVSQVRDVISNLKINRSPGTDEVTSSMMPHASPSSLDLLTGLVNEAIGSGRVPEALLEGRMSLIDKKSPSLFVHETRPLTVSSILLSVITKIVHKRMNKVCEREGFYGSCQFGFRQNHSTTDCVFILFAAIRKAKRNGY